MKSPATQTDIQVWGTVNMWKNGILHSDNTNKSSEGHACNVRVPFGTAQIVDWNELHVAEHICEWSAFQWGEINFNSSFIDEIKSSLSS